MHKKDHVRDVLTENQLDVHSLMCFFLNVGTNTSLKGAMAFPYRGSIQKALEGSSAPKKAHFSHNI